MAATFSRTLRFLETDRSRRTISGLLLAGLLTGWLGWLGLGRVTVYEVSATARLEVQTSAHPVAAPVGGQVAQTHLMIGTEVAAGDVLVVLDTETERRAIAEKLEQCQALRARRKAIASETQAEEQGLLAIVAARSAAIREAKAQLAAAEARAQYAESSVQRLQGLAARKVATDDDLQKGIAEARVNRATVEALTLGMTRQEQERVVKESECRTRLAKLNRESVDLDGQLAVEEAAVRRLDHDIELRTIRAPVAGRVEEVLPFRVGSVVRLAERLGTLVPPGQPRAVAMFPAAAVGRIRPGQQARLRLEGFPWTQYGLLPATVSGAGSEASEGLVRVELTLAAGGDSPIPLQHGLPGTVEVAVEQVSPAVLVLRAAGRFLTARQTPRSPQDNARREP